MQHATKVHYNITPYLLYIYIDKYIYNRKMISLIDNILNCKSKDILW